MTRFITALVLLGWIKFVVWPWPILKLCQLMIALRLLVTLSVFAFGCVKVALPLTTCGHAPVPCFGFDHPDNLALQTLYTRRMLDRDILANFAVSICLAHKEEHVEQYLKAAAEVYPELAEAMEKGDAAERIGGPIRHTAFTRLA